MPNINDDDFRVIDGVLLKYEGRGGDVVIPGSVTSIGIEAFKGCPGLRLEAPATSVSVLSAMRLGPQAGYGFLLARERFTDPGIAGEYREYCVSQYKKLLTVIFRNDDAEALRFYIDEKKVTPENFDADYFSRAVKAGAENCVSALLKWKQRH